MHLFVRRSFAAPAGAALALVFVSATEAQITVNQVVRSIRADADRVLGDATNDLVESNGPGDSTLWSETVSGSDKSMLAMSTIHEAAARAHQTSAADATGAVVSGYIDGESTMWTFSGANNGACFPNSRSSFSMNFSVADTVNWSLRGALTLDNRGGVTAGQGDVTVQLLDTTGAPVHSQTLCTTGDCSGDVATLVDAGGSIMAGDYTLIVSAETSEFACVGPSATPTIGQRLSYAVSLEVSGLTASGCVGDLTGDDVVDGADLAALLAGWGACP